MEVTKKLQLKHLISKVLKGLQFLAISKSSYTRRVNYISDIDDDDDEENETSTRMQEGYFAVIAMQGEETKKFIVELDFLKDPDFMKLLEKAKEEYGYEQKGAIAVPCRPQELQKILENRHNPAM